MFIHALFDNLQFILLQLAASFLDTAKSFNNVFVTRGIAHAETFGRTKGGTTDCGYMTYFEEINGKVHRILNDTFTVCLTKVIAALGEEVESTMRLVHFKARHVLSQLHNQILTTLESLTHFFYALLWTCESLSSGYLTYRARTAGILSLQLAASLCNFERSC